MTEKFYFDTSIWLDFFEERDEPNFPKSQWANNLPNKIIRTDGRIIVSDIVVNELILIGYTLNEIENLLKPLKSILIFVEATKQQVGRARDLASKRDIPKNDALHALIARDDKAILVTLDNHFKKIRDIIEPNSPKKLI